MWLYALPLLILHSIVALIRNTLSSFKHLCPPGSFTNSVFAAAFDYVWQIQCHLLALRFLSPPFFPCVVSEMSLRAASSSLGPGGSSCAEVWEGTRGAALAAKPREAVVVLMLIH